MEIQQGCGPGGPELAVFLFFHQSNKTKNAVFFQYAYTCRANIYTLLIKLTLQVIKMVKVSLSE